MSRDHHRLKVYEGADALVLDVSRVTSALEAEERYGPPARATASSRASLEVALGSASEARYLLGVAERLQPLPAARVVIERYCALVRSLQRRLATFRKRPDASPSPPADEPTR